MVLQQRLKPLVDVARVMPGLNWNRLFSTAFSVPGGGEAEGVIHAAVEGVHRVEQCEGFLFVRGKGFGWMLLRGGDDRLETAVNQAGKDEVFAEVLEDGGVCRGFDAARDEECARGAEGDGVERSLGFLRVLRLGRRLCGIELLAQSLCVLEADFDEVEEAAGAL